MWVIKGDTRSVDCWVWGFWASAWAWSIFGFNGFKPDPWRIAAWGLGQHGSFSAPRERTR